MSTVVGTEPIRLTYSAKGVLGIDDQVPATVRERLLPTVEALRAGKGIRRRHVVRAFEEAGFRVVGPTVGDGYRRTGFILLENPATEVGQ